MQILWTWFTSDNEYENTFFLPVFTQNGDFTVHVSHSTGCSNQSDTHRTPALHWSTVNLDHVASGEAYGHIQSG